MTFDDPKIVMENFAEWLKENSKGSPIFIADNNGFDWQWINFYFHYYTGKNPVSDAKGNAEVVLKMQNMGLKIDLR